MGERSLGSGWRARWGRLNRHTALLRQYGPFERVALVASVELQKVLTPLASYLESKQVFDYVRGARGRVAREGTRNLVELGDSSLGQVSVRLRRRTSDFAVFQQCFIERQYEPLARLARHCSPKGAELTVVDLGANIGLATIFLSRALPTSRVLAVEAEHANYRLCCENVALNQLPQTTVHHAAVWTADGPVGLARDFRDRREWAIRVTGGAADGAASDVEGLRMTTLLERFGFTEVDVLKLDVEGTEKDLFANERDLADWLPRVRILAIETHDAAGGELVLASLQRHGFFSFRQGELILAVRESAVDRAHLLEGMRLSPVSPRFSVDNRDGGS